VQQVRKPRDIALWARHADPTRGQDRVTLAISSTIGTANCGRTGLPRVAAIRASLR
jgi:hypothetical protein